ncbi:MAG: hypothetical protein AB7Q29_16995 [Vicinamibacterales bacterium]
MTLIHGASRRYVALALALLLGGVSSGAQIGPPPDSGLVLLAGRADDEAEKPYSRYTVQLRDIEDARVTGSLRLDEKARFEFSGLPEAVYLVELLDARGRVVCTEGPFDLRKDPATRDVVIACGHIPAAWWLLAGAATAGITAGALGQQASPSR